MIIVQIGSNRGNDKLTEFIKNNNIKLDFGLFVEPMSIHTNELKECYKDYPNAVIENIGIKLPNDDKKELILYYHLDDLPNYEVTSFNRDHVFSHLNSDRIESIVVPALTLEELLDKYNLKKIDWLLIDVEGLDGDIVDTFNWSKYEIDRVDVEHIHWGEKRDYLFQKFYDMGYKHVVANDVRYDVAFEKIKKKFTPNTKSVNLKQENGEYNGWVEKTTSVWWLDETVKDSFTFYNLDTFYNEDYFDNDHVVEQIVNNYVNYVSHFFKKITNRNLKNVLEIGTAGGWFTKKFQDEGYDIFGLEGSSCGIDATLKKGISPEKILKHDLRLPINLEKKFDIVCCTEVAEHLEIPFAGTLIKTLVDHSDVVWFSSAPPYVLQMPSSYHHPNEQPDIFWINLFDFFNYGYVKLSDEIYSETNLRGRYIFYNKNVYNVKETLFEKEMPVIEKKPEYDSYRQRQIDSELFESTFDRYAGGQVFSLETFLIPIAKKNNKILDAGCGDGTDLKFLSDNGFQDLYGIDINPNKYFLAKNYIGDNRVFDSDITNTPFGDEEFDFIWCSHVLEHSYDPIKSLKELQRICKKGGHILLVLPYPTPHSDVHCGVNDLRLNINDNGNSCISNIINNGFNVDQHYTMNIREPELFLKIKV